MAKRLLVFAPLNLANVRENLRRLRDIMVVKENGGGVGIRAEWWRLFTMVVEESYGGDLMVVEES